MKKARFSIVGLPVLVAVLFSFAGSPALAQETISVSPGSTEVREFYLFDVFDSGCLCPVQGYIIYSLGFSVPAADLTITVEPDPEREFTSRVEYSALGAGLSIDEGLAIISASGADPGPAATVVVPINSTFGIYGIVIFISGVEREQGVDFPVPFTVTFSVSEGEAPEEEPTEE